MFDDMWSDGLGQTRFADVIGWTFLVGTFNYFSFKKIGWLSFIQKCASSFNADNNKYNYIIFIFWSAEQKAKLTLCTFQEHFVISLHYDVIVIT